MESKRLIDKWIKKLQLDGWKIITESIDPKQVVVDKSIPKKDRSFVGIKYDEKKKTAIIYHDRELLEEDILHELIHVKFTYYKEYEVVELTEYLMKEDE